MRWLGDVGYKLFIADKGGLQAYVTWRVAPAREAVTRLSVAVYPHLFQKARPLRRVLHVFYIRLCLWR